MSANVTTTTADRDDIRPPIDIHILRSGDKVAIAATMPGKRGHVHIPLDILRRSDDGKLLSLDLDALDAYLHDVETEAGGHERHWSNLERPRWPDGVRTSFPMTYFDGRWIAWPQEV